MTTPTSLQAKTIELLATYRQQPSIQLRNQIVRLNMGLVRKMAHRLAHQCAEPYEDLEQCGYLGLIAAIERFDPSQGAAFSSFAVPYIRGEILHFLRDRAYSVRIPRRWQQLSQEGQKVREALTVKLGRLPAESEIATALNLSLEEWRMVKLAASNRVPLSLNTRAPFSSYHQADAPVTLEELLVDVHSQILRGIEEDCLELQQAMSQLEEKNRQVLESVFFQHLSRQEVAQQIGISPVTVTRRIKSGIAELVVLLKQPLPLGRTT